MANPSKIDCDITVLWQSLVVGSYRSFFVNLSQYTNGRTTLISPHRFKELGSQWVDCEPFDDEKVRFEILKVIYFHVQIVFFMGLGRLWKRTFRSEKDHIFICLAEPYSLTALFCYLQIWITGKKPKYFMLYGLQNIDKKHSFFIKKVQDFLFRRVSHILFTSSEQEYVLRRQGYEGSALEFPLWFNDQIFNIQDLASLRAQSNPYKNLDSRRIWLGYAGSLFEEKGLEDLFLAVQKLPAKQRESVCLLVAGQGPLETVVINALMELEKIGVQTLFLGSLKSDEMREFFNVIDLLLVPSRTKPFWKEQFGRVIVEAEACGAVALGSDSGAIGEVLGDSERIFKECNPDSLLAKLHFWLEKIEPMSANERRLLRERMRARAVNRYGDRKLAEKFFEKLRTL